MFPEAARQHIRASDSVNSQLNELFLYAGDHGHPAVCAHRRVRQLCQHGAGLSRRRGVSGVHVTAAASIATFFATLKDGTGYSEGGLERMFITGVSPITMDDVTSGFNIGKNISLHPEFNDMLGFTEEEVRNLLEMYRDYGVFNQEVEAALAVMREWYNGYRFAKSAQGDLYNTDMVLYFLDESTPNRGMPDELIDTNVRIDYGKLRHLLTVNRQLNGNFDLLRHIIGEAEHRQQHPTQLPLGPAGPTRKLPVAAALLRPAQHSRRGARDAPAGHSQSNGQAADVRLPARCLR